MQSTLCTSVPGLWLPLILLLWLPRDASLLGPLPRLSSFALQPAHSLLPPLRSHGAEVSQKMALRPRDRCSTRLKNSMDRGLSMYYMDKPKLNMSQKLVVYIFLF